MGWCSTPWSSWSARLRPRRPPTTRRHRTPRRSGPRRARRRGANRLAAPGAMKEHGVDGATAGGASVADNEEKLGLDHGGAPGEGYDPNGDGRLRAEFVEQWRTNAYGCFSSGHKFCREV